MEKLRRKLVLAATGLAAGAAALVLGIGSSDAAERSCDVATITWDGGAGTNNWTTAANWTGNRLPGINDHVCIPADASVDVVQITGGSNSLRSLDARKPIRMTAGILSVSDTALTSRFAGFTMLTGTFSGTGNRVLEGTSAMSGGTISSGGTITIPSGSSFAVDGTATKTLGGPMVLDGTMTVAGTGGITLGAPITVDGGGVLDLTADTPFPGGTSAKDAIKVQSGGIFRKSGGTGAVRLMTPVENDGLVESRAGTLDLNDGTTTLGPSSGRYVAATGGRILFSRATNTMAAGATLEGPGAIDLNGGNLTGPFTVTPGTTLTWTLGTIDGPNITVADDAKVVVNGTIQKFLLGQMRNEGTIEIGGSGTVIWGATAAISNHGLIDFVTDAPLSHASVTASDWVIRNESDGLMRKSAGTRSDVGVPVDNDGLVRSEAGTLALSGGSGPNNASAGRFEALPGGPAVTFANGTHVLAPGSTMSGFGTTGLELGGQLQGTLTVKEGTTFTWTSGRLNVSEGSVIEPGAAFVVTGDAARAWNGALRNEGTMVFTNTGQLGVSSLAVTNAGTVDFAGPAPMVCSCGDPKSTWRNERFGVIRKSAGTETRMLPKFWNEGDVIVAPGTALWFTFPEDVSTGVSGVWGGTGTWTAGGTLTLQGRVIESVQANVTLEPTGRIESDVARPAIRQLKQIGGRFAINGQNLTAYKDLGVSGTLALGNGAQVSAVDSVTNSGRVELAPTAAVATSELRLTRGILTGAGQVTGNVQNGGAISPTGELRIGGTYSQAGQGVLEHVAGPEAGTVRVNGPVYLDGGILRVRVAPGATPTAGQQHTILAGAVHRDHTRLDRIDVDDLGGGIAFLPNVGTGGITVAVGPRA